MAKSQPERSNFLFHQQWDYILNFFLDSGNVLPESCFHFENEFKTANSILSCENSRTILNLWLNAIPEISHQSLQTAQSYLDQGDSILMNTAKIRENSYTAFNYYTKALYAAPNPEIAALCHAQRGSALMQLGFFEEAYDDGNSAIELGYSPGGIRDFYQGQVATAAADTQKILKSVEMIKETAKKLDACVQINHLKKLLIDSNCKIPAIKETKIQEKKQKITSQPTKGKFIIAAETIQKNEPIMAEKAFAFVPIYGQIQQVIDCNCQNCGQENIIPFPCYICTKICYCSLKCRNQHRSIHSIECKGSQKNLFFEIGVGHLAFRTLLVGIDTLTNYISKTSKNQELKMEEMWSKILEFGDKDTSEYAAVIKLVTNFNKMDIKDYLRYALTGSMLTCYLKNFTNFFKVNIPKKCYDIMKSKADWHIIIAAVITRHIGQMICNAHTIPGLVLSMDKSKNIYKMKNHLIPGKLHYYSQSAQIYAAIYPRISMYNHSCEPNIRFRFNKSKIIVFANKHIPIGYEIQNCYARNYKRKPRDVRLSELKAQYFFRCTCNHCKDPNDTKYRRANSFRCNQKICSNEFYPDKQAKNLWIDGEFDSSITIACPKCSVILNFEWFEEYEMLTNQFHSDKKKEQLYRICELYEHAKKALVGAHHMKLSMCFMGIKSAIASLEGQKIDKRLYAKLIQMGIDWLNYSEELYGLYDLEYVSATTMVLDLLIILKQHGEKMNFDYDLTKVKKSFGILSEQTKFIFDKYFDEYIKEFM